MDLMDPNLLPDVVNSLCLTIICTIQQRESSTLTITLGADWLESSLAEKGLGVLVDLTIIHQAKGPTAGPPDSLIAHTLLLRVTPQPVGGLEKELPGLDNRLTFLDLTERDQELHYGTLLGTTACVRMAAAAWATGFLNALLHTANTFSIPLCQGNVVDQFFCEIPHVLKLSCSHSYLREVGLNVVNACLFLGCFIFIVLSYMQIFRAVLRMPSEQGRHKAFSMCLPHLAVVSLFLSSGMFTYMKPPSMSSPALDLVVAVVYSVVPPAVNPLLYSMRNKELKNALRKLI
ncbi:olfactory receptor 14J1-like [Struthio camelus]|uniref:olfactory receptor 14J1-like n=1 Tax=Struthio camelus TaxID=8801 RepID=UPI0036041BE3